MYFMGVRCANYGFELVTAVKANDSIYDLSLF